MKTNLIDIEVFKHLETEKAYLISVDGVRSHAIWIPKSQCEFDRQGSGNIGTLTIAETVATEKGLV